jgi:CheY-like chemotaxis protein
MAAGARVLVVDDDEIIRGFLAEALADEGYEVRAAGEGAHALATLRGWPAELIVLDLMMPVMDGWAFRAVQRQDPELAHIPVVVLSATREVQLQARPLDVAAVFAKPFDLDELLTVIGELLGRRA